jgi:hypothetical protein
VFRILKIEFYSEIKTDQIEIKTNQIEIKTNQMESKTNQIEIKTYQIESKTNQMESKIRYVKILNKDLNHNSFQYKEGINIDTIPFNPKGSCSAGGLYFAKVSDIYLYFNYGMYIADIELLPDSKVYDEGNKLKTDKFIIKNIVKIEDSDIWNNVELCRMAIAKDGRNLRHVKEQTEELCRMAVAQCGSNLGHVKEQTEDLCRMAIVQDGSNLYHVD